MLGCSEVGSWCLLPPQPQPALRSPHGLPLGHDDPWLPWKLMATNTHIMKLADVEKAADELHTPSLSKMMFERRFKNPALFWLWD